MNEILYSIVLSVILAVYFVFLYKNTGRRRDSKVMGSSVAAIFAAGLLLHLVIYYRTAVARESLYDLVTILYYSIQHSLKMFLGNTPIYRMLGDIKDMPVFYQLYVLVFYMAVLTSGFLIFNFLSRSLYTRRWLKKRKNREQASKGGNSIFLGVNRYAELLAGNIRKEATDSDEKGMIIFIDPLPLHGFGILGHNIPAKLAHWSQNLNNTLDPLIGLAVFTLFQRLDQFIHLALGFLILEGEKHSGFNEH